MKKASPAGGAPPHPHSDSASAREMAAEALGGHSLRDASWLARPSADHFLIPWTDHPFRPSPRSYPTDGLRSDPANHHGGAFHLMLASEMVLAIVLPDRAG